MKANKIAEGKTKVIREDQDDPGCVLVESKDDITAGDGASHDVLEGKAVAATTTTSNVFRLLEANGIPTQYLGRINDWTFRALKAEMVPLELVTRRIATGSYLKRNPDAIEGEVFEDLVFEIFHKDDAAHDPIVAFDESGTEATRYPADQPREDTFFLDKLDSDDLSLGRFPDDTLLQLEKTTRAVFEAIEAAWAEQDVQLVDLKIECGWVDTPDGPRLVVADVIDNDSWRIWPAGDKEQMKDKQVYRNLAGVDDPKAKAKELGTIKKNYQWVAAATGKFAS